MILGSRSGSRFEQSPYRLHVSVLPQTHAGGSVRCGGIEERGPAFPVPDVQVGAPVDQQTQDVEVGADGHAGKPDG